MKLFPATSPLTSRRGRRAVVIGAMVVALGAAGSIAAVRWHGSLPSNAVFKYDGQVVTVPELDQRIHLLTALYGVQEPTAAAAQQTFERAAAQSDAMSLVLDHAAAAQGVVIADKQARDTLQKMIEQQLGSNPQQSFDAMLTKFGVSEDDVLSEVKRQQEIGLLFQKVTASAAATPSDADVAAYFAAHEAQFDVPAKRHLLNIVVKTQAQAAKLLPLARQQDFATLAKTYSLDDSTRSKGGDLGTVAASALEDAYAKAAFAAKPGAVFGPVQTDHGWNVGKVVSVTAGRKVTLAKVRAKVVTALKSQRELAAWDAWLTGQIKDADIQYADDYRPADPDALPSSAVSPAGAAQGTTP